MKPFKYFFTCFLFYCLVLAGCDKYLDVQPKGKTLLTTVTNYDQWLNDPSLDAGFSPYMNFLGDNFDLVNITTPPTLQTEMIYTWQLQFSTDLTVSPEFWGYHYKTINQYNTVILGIDAATGGTSIQKKSLKAEALLGRAYEYFYLLNEYGKPYDATTASTDLAVPFVTSNDVSQKVPDRATVAFVYNTIISDLNTAIPDLPADNSTDRFRGSQAAAYSVLARIYFYAADYTNARKNAELAVANTKAVMVNYNSTLPTSNLISVFPDVIYGRTLNGSATPTLDFLRSFASNDLRLTKLYTTTDNYALKVRGTTVFQPLTRTPILANVNMGTSIQEMKLIIAESAARNGDLTTALQQLDDIRKTRFTTATYVRYQSAVQEDVLQEVLNERSHELAFNGLRWFDMRRLDKENRMPTVNRYNALGGIVATLPPHSDRYSLQIPIQVLNFNPGMQQNP